MTTFYSLRASDLLRRSAALFLVLAMLAVAGCDSSEDPQPTTGTITGSISLPQGAGGDIVNTRVALFETLDEFRNNASTFSTTADASGNYTFENINPDSYYLAAFKDNNNTGIIDAGDFYGYLGGGPLEPAQATPQRQQVVAGQNTDINFVIQIVPPGFGISVTGTYSGSSQGITVTLTLTESGGTVTGSGSIVEGANTFPVTVSGTFNAPNVNLNLTSAQLQGPVQLTGTVADDGSSINGMMNGSGLTNFPITLTLQ